MRRQLLAAAACVLILVVPASARAPVGLVAAQATPTTFDVAPWGNDTTCTGVPSCPYATIAKAQSRVPDVLNVPYTIRVASGVYNDALDIRRFTGLRSRPLTIQGSGSVTLTGQVATSRDVGWTGTATGIIEGPVYVKLTGLTLRAPSGSDAVLAVQYDGRASLSGVTLTTNGTVNDGLVVNEQGQVELAGDLSVSSASRWALDVVYGSEVRVAQTGTVNLGCVGQTGQGVHVFSQSRVISYAPNLAVNVTGCQIAFQLGLHAEVQIKGAGSRIVARGYSLPGSEFVLGTDLSTFSADGPLTVDGFATRAHVNSISYFEHFGQTTFISTGGDDVSQSSVVLWG